MIHDGLCHDICNFKRFDFDGMDCCLQQIETDDCEDCICHLDGTVHFSTGFVCPHFNIGNGFCEDFCNFELRHFDGLDCCQEQIADEHCIDCICHLDGLRRPSSQYLFY